LACGWLKPVRRQRFARQQHLGAAIEIYPVALPAAIMHATAIEAQALAKPGILPTRLSTVHGAASMAVLRSE
jgi:magnesium-transporting ATPase (P-type)